MITSRWKISNLPQNQIKGKIVRCPKSQNQQMPKHMVHPQGNGIAQNTKYEEMINMCYLYKLEIRSNTLVFFKLLHLQSNKHIDKHMVFI